ncbi:anhydro-N-acetylmuramic acid kinase [Ilyomonas limi]|uniref:Anhydro-N-acetylmuramic acid kinase n=1 Tax=Ilyomonas limi TaxID=2575867 RepID=A0A4U3L936_9BACT|nr:anhydro-N-acetylmuramic acid kinase [Ilyomonas limi]TKK71798.1 anhydro-N-acetylmuramic acid kinase [Ilyomonas limi]
MVYKAIGLMSGSSLDGLDIVFAELSEQRGKWSYEIQAAETMPYNAHWKKALASATQLTAYDYLQLHAAYGKHLGEAVNAFIDKYNLHHQVQLIGSHGHTVFHAPDKGFTAQLGDGATVAATTGINVIGDLRTMDVALGGQGAPIVPMGEKLLFEEYNLLLNIGGIANLSYRENDRYIAFDICPANAILNKLAAATGMEYDTGGNLAATGTVNEALLQQLNAQPYYTLQPPKSLDNGFGYAKMYPLVQSFSLSASDALRTYTEHIAMQVSNSIWHIGQMPSTTTLQLLITGGGGFNTFLVERIQAAVEKYNIEVVLPPAEVINYKEALIMALLGVLRWREENTVLASVTGALRSSIGGAVWIGLEA